MPTVLITGASRGIGVELARQYQAHGWDVIATVRDSGTRISDRGIRVETVDMSHLDEVAAFGSRLDGPLDLLIANAGIYGPRDVGDDKEAEAWLGVFRVNSIAPVLLAQALMPQLAQAKGKAIAISSQMGSIANSSTGSIPYRSSKAALNMAWHVLAAEAKAQKVIMAALHPGWVKTDMGGPNAAIGVVESVSGMRRVIDGLTMDQSGGFYSYDGSELPW